MQSKERAKKIFELEEGSKIRNMIAQGFRVPEINDAVIKRGNKNVIKDLQQLKKMGGSE